MARRRVAGVRLARDAIRAWQGLGYNRRALNLHRAACVVAASGWPADLTSCPAWALHRRCDSQPGPRRGRAAHRTERAADSRPHRRHLSGASLQALFDLGATVCLARIPRCDACPLAVDCPRAGHDSSPRAGRGRWRARSASAGHGHRLVADGTHRLAELDQAALVSLERDGLVVLDGDTAALPA